MNQSPLKENNDKLSPLERVISSSALKEAKKSTRHFLYYYEKEKTSASHFDFGNAIELYLIDRENFGKKVVVFNEEALIKKVMDSNPAVSSPRATKIYKEAKESFDTENVGKYIINKTGPESMEIIEIIANMMLDHPDIDLLFGGNYQDPFEWTCPRTGLKRYARTDIFKPDEEIIIDIKTDADDDFERTATKFDYWIQAYDQMVGAIESGKMKEVKAYYWFVISKKAPYFIDFFKIDIEQLLKVEESYWSTLIRLKNDLSGNPDKIVWHKTPIQNIKVPNYYK